MNTETKEVAATAVQGAEQQGEEGPEVIYELLLPKPVPIRFARGNDGKPYVKQVRPGSGLETKVEPGDQMLAVSASFGDEIWSADSYGQVVAGVGERWSRVAIAYRA